MTAALPGPKGLPYIGSLLPAYRDPLGFIVDVVRVHGDRAYARIGPARVFLLNHPDLVREVLVTQHSAFVKGRGLQAAKRFLGEGLLTSEGTFHQHQRRLLQPAFHRQRLGGYSGMMTASAARLSERWHEGATVDVAEEMMRLNLTVVGRTLLNLDIEENAAEIGLLLSTLQEDFSSFALPFAGLRERLPLPGARRRRAAVRRLRTLIVQLIRERRVSSTDQGDVLSTLLQARDVAGDGLGMTDAQMGDEVITLVLAGFETTSVALTWTWYLLSQHPHVEAAVHAELAAVLAGRSPGMDDLRRLPYTDAVFTEALRLYPPAWGIPRRAVAACIIGGHAVPAGASVSMCPYVVHRDPRYHQDPEVFSPERWLRASETSLPPYAYFPFGGGPRRCIGEQFARTMALVTIAVLAQRWRLRLVQGHAVALQPQITLRPRYGMRMTLERRAAPS
jgi:cytochrome P450